jgi:hypothetical protein
MPPLRVRSRLGLAAVAVTALLLGTGGALSDAHVRQSRQGATDQALRDRLTRAQLVVLGTVTVVRHVEVRPRPPISEHDPDWRDATIKVERPLKGSLTPGTDTVHVLFPASRDVRWFQSPKFTQGQVGIFLLHLGELPATVIPKTAEPAYTALNALDCQNRDQVSRITRLLSLPTQEVGSMGRVPAANRRS